MDSGIRGRGGAGFQMGKKVSFLPHGDMDKYLVCNADESEPGTFKDRELMQKSPHMLIEGIVIASYAGEIDRAFIYIRGEYQLQADILEAAIAEAARGRLPRRATSSAPGTRPAAGAAPRRRRLHLRRGDRAARLAGGQARQPAAEAAVPGDRGPLPRPDADQQRRDAVPPCPHIIRMGGAEYAKIGTETSTGTKLVSVSGDVKRPGNYEIELGIPSREIIYGLAGGPPEGQRGQVLVPGRLELAGADQGRPRRPLRLRQRWPRPGSMLGSGAIIVVDESRTRARGRAQAGQVLRPRVVRQVRPLPRGHQLDRTRCSQRIESGEATPMDLDIMASVQEQIIGNCLCVLGDAMAMPIGSMVEKFRAELEAEIEAARERADAAALEDVVALGRRRRARRPDSRPLSSAAARMPRPEQKTIQLTIDGREVQAVEGAMLVDAAKQGDVEIPYFCYEPKLGHPVGACRMCLVEIEGIPKLQTSCSTPVKDGMVVHTQTDRVRHAQNAIVEFLLVNHPLDCPVCDKGGECPLQDITFGWGLGRSRLIEPKRHFAEAAGALAAGRDRPRALHPLLPLRALLPGDRRGLPADLRRARRRTRSSPPTTATPTWRRSAATSSSCARSAR